jgi:hypothetical protein
MLEVPKAAQRKRGDDQSTDGRAKSQIRRDNGPGQVFPVSLEVAAEK